MNQRIAYLDFFRGLLILTVVAEHIIKMSILADGVLRHPINNLFTSFNMVAFFILSGYMLHYSMKHMDTIYDVLNHIGKRAIQCLLPYIVWGWVLNYTFTGSYNILNYFDDLIMGRLQGLWFLLCLFIIDSIASIILVIGKHKLWQQVALSVIVEIILLLLKNVRIPILFNVYYYLPFFIMGWLINRCAWKSLYESPLIGGAWIILFLLLTPLFTFQESPLYLRVSIAISGTMALWFICSKIEQSKITGAFELIGRYTLPIYCIHACMMSNVDLSMHTWVVYDFIRVGGLSIAIAFVCIGLSRVFSFSPVTDLLFNGHLKMK